MTGISLLPTVLGAAAILAGAAMFTVTLVGIRRRTRSANLEYGYVPAGFIAFGLGLFDWGIGWPGWPLAAYLLLLFGLAALFAIVIVLARPRAE